MLPQDQLDQFEAERRMLLSQTDAAQSEVNKAEHGVRQATGTSESEAEDTPCHEDQG